MRGDYSIREKIKYTLSKVGYKTRPDFIILGAQKAGTTGLFRILNQHSLLMGSKKKEVHFFDDDQWYSEKKLHEYHSFFPFPHKVSKEAKLFEATPLYLFHPKAAERLHNYNSDLKFIIVLRNPVDRAFSAWTMYHHHFKSEKNRHTYDPRSFSEAISEELETIDYAGFYEDRRSYIKRGMYHHQISRYLNYFSPKQMLVIESGALKCRFEKTSNELQSFLEVPREDLKLQKVHKSRIDDKHLYKHTLLRLQEFFESHNRKLFDLLGRTFDWNNGNVTKSSDRE